MALPAGFLDELRARTPIAAVIGRKVKLARSGRQWKGCCPFHGEKTPSFYVYDDHFHCFGCGAHGDAVSFIMQSQGSSFPEAVEQLASEAGMDVPKPTPAAAEAERRRLDLHGVLEAASAVYRRWLQAPGGARALSYLRGRGLTDETIERFGLGWSGEGRGAMAAELAREGVELPMLVDAGLMKPPEEGRPAYDLFFNRVMFPIRDRRGRVISFGGRIMGDGQPKYVNGPETALFSKRRTLYGLNFAREGARAGGEVLAVEGYMDVIALHQAGFAAAVAPLGTALTEEQLEEMLRLSPNPILCFDGDAAGARAAMRTIELALPNLTPERSLRLITLPKGDDPDSLLRRGGPAAFTTILSGARPLGDVLYDLLREGVNEASPEQRAAFRTRLVEVSGRIADKGLASEYRRMLLDRFFSDRPKQQKRGSAPAPRRQATYPRPVPGPDTAAVERARHLVAILLRHPRLLHDVEEAFGTLTLPATLADLRDAILSWGSTAEVLDSGALMNHLTQVGLAAQAAQALSAVPTPLAACASPDAMPAEAEAGWWHFFGLMNPVRLDEEVSLAARELASRTSEALQRRLITLVEARNALRQGDLGSEAND